MIKLILFYKHTVIALAILIALVIISFQLYILIHDGIYVNNRGFRSIPVQVNNSVYSPIPINDVNQR